MNTSPLTFYPNLPLANVITTLRLGLLLIVIAITYQLTPIWMYLNVFLLVLMFSTDALDGYVARARNESSEFGAVYDIAIDRIVEISLWIVFFDLNYVPLWVVLLFVIRGGLVDAIRNSFVAAKGKSPFSMLTSKFGTWLVSSKSMRVFYAVIKAVTFCWLALIEALKWSAPNLQLDFHLIPIALVLIYSSAFLCLVRGLPVIVEYLADQRQR